MIGDEDAKEFFQEGTSGKFREVFDFKADAMFVSEGNPRPFCQLMPKADITVERDSALIFSLLHDKMFPMILNCDIGAQGGVEWAQLSMMGKVAEDINMAIPFNCLVKINGYTFFQFVVDTSTSAELCLEKPLARCEAEGALGRAVEITSQFDTYIRGKVVGIIVE